MDKVDVVPPPDITTIGERLRRLYAEARKDDYKGLPKSALRKLPFTYWVENHPALPTTDPILVNRYWSEVVQEATQGNPRRAKRWLSPLFYVYCVSFDIETPSFLHFAHQLNQIMQRATGAYAAKLSEMNISVAFFRPAEVPQKLATRVLASTSVSFDQVLQNHLLWPGFVDTALGHEVLEAALRLPHSVLTEQSAVSRLLQWINRLAAPIHKSDLRVGFANALLEPWHQRQPPEQLKKLLVEFFVHKDSYGDPRIEGNYQYQWRGVSDKALATLFNWLAGDTLRGFMTLLARTADEIWRFRQKFWMSYYDKGLIDEAWLALGPHAVQEARKLMNDHKGIGFGRLDGGAANNQSVLLLRLGNLVFTEWSHNGSLRAYEDTSADAPKLYGKFYSGNDLRAARSLDFHDGVNLRPELAHHHSDSGTWQRKARDFIRSRTGVYLSDREIL